MAATMGKDGFVSLDGTTEKPAYLDNWTLTPSIGTAEVTAYGNASKVFVSTLREWSVTAGGTLDRSDAKQLAVLQMFESTASSTSVTLRLYDSTSYWTGSAFVTSAPINSQVGDKVTVSFNFQGTGDLSYITT